VLGLDGGGTKTLLAMVDRQGKVRLLGRGGGINPISDPAWHDELAAILAPARPFLPAVRQSVLGLPAYGEVAEVSAEQERAAATLLPDPVLVENDVHVAFDGAFAGQAGVLILAGTGSMAWGGDGAEHFIRVGGWGEGFGDDGSAWWIGHEAINRLSRVLDGRLAGDGFAAGILDAIGVTPQNAHAALIGWYHGLRHPRAQVAALARRVDELAERDDPMACALLAEAAAHLVAHVEAAGRRLRVATPAWSYAGGVFRSRTVMRLMTGRKGPPQPPLLPPIGGALWRAARTAGWHPDATWIGRLGVSLTEPGEEP